jgi:hypothetical protein
MPKMLVTAGMTMTNNKKERSMNSQKQTQTKPNLTKKHACKAKSNPIKAKFFSSILLRKAEGRNSTIYTKQARFCFTNGINYANYADKFVNSSEAADAGRITPA